MVDVVGSFDSQNSGYKSIESCYEELHAAQSDLAAGAEFRDQDLPDMDAVLKGEEWIWESVEQS